MCKQLDPVLEALYAWGEADMDWMYDPCNLELGFEAEEKRKDYLRVCAEYGEEPVDGAVRF